MAVPDYQSLMLPVLQVAGDGQEHTIPEVSEIVANVLALPNEDRSELLPSGKQRKLVNRISWAKIYMAKAGLLEAVGRGKFKITTRGAALLKTNPTRIDIAVLSQYPEFLEFRERSKPNKTDMASGSEPEVPTAQQTPQEVLESSYQALHAQVAEDLLERIAKVSPPFFEKLVVDLLVAMGYGGSRKDAGQAIGKSGDDGIDGIIKEDRLGLDAVYIQAKRWKGTVGRPDVQSFAGSLEGHRARKGVFITPSQFSMEAREYVNRIEKKIILIDGERLADLCLEFGIGVEPVTTYKVQRIDSDYFEEE
ncbi:MAG TPA: restriction endonuclease [Terracidiphilus sp.]|jgi:restriction system protein